MSRKRAHVELMDHAKKLAVDDESSVGMRDDETQGPPSTDVSIERLDQEHQGAFYSLSCPICSTYLGADVALDGHEKLEEFHKMYYTIRDVLSEQELVRTLTEKYNDLLAEEGEVVTEAQVKNHFDSNHLQSAELSISQSIKRLEVSEKQLAKISYAINEAGKMELNEKHYNAMLKTMQVKALMWKAKREFKQRV